MALDISGPQIVGHGILRVPVANYAAGAAANHIVQKHSGILATDVVVITPLNVAAADMFVGAASSLSVHVNRTAGAIRLTFDDVNIAAEAQFAYIVTRA